MRIRSHLLAPLALALLVGSVVPAQAQVDRLCDPGDESCRNILISYIDNEKLGIDVAFWFMEDPNFWIHSRWSDEAAFEVHAELPRTQRFVERMQELIDHPFEANRARQIA